MWRLLICSAFAPIMVIALCFEEFKSELSDCNEAKPKIKMTLEVVDNDSPSYLVPSWKLFYTAWQSCNSFYILLVN